MYYRFHARLLKLLLDYVSLNSRDGMERSSSVVSGIERRKHAQEDYLWLPLAHIDRSVTPILLRKWLIKQTPLRCSCLCHQLFRSLLHYSSRNISTFILAAYRGLKTFGPCPLTEKRKEDWARQWPWRNQLWTWHSYPMQRSWQALLWSWNPC